MTLSSPAAVQSRLEAIEVDLAVRQADYEKAALAWFRTKRDRERRRAEEFIKAEGTVAERHALADRETALIGYEEEASFEALKAVVRTLEARSTIGMAILKTQARLS